MESHGSTRPQESSSSSSGEAEVSSIPLEVVIFGEGGIDQSLLIGGDELLITTNRIGSGTFSDVYEGRYKGLFVAVKEFRSFHSSGQITKCQSTLERFRQEVKMLSKINHQNIVKLVGVSLAPKLVIVTELIEGGTLKDYIYSNETPSTPDKTGVCLGIALDIATAVEYLDRQQILHCDIKPENLILTIDQKKTKLIDFDRAINKPIRVDRPKSKRYNWCKGPETINLDMYHFAILLWALFADKHDPIELWEFYSTDGIVTPDISKVPEGALQTLIVNCCVEDPDDRPEWSYITHMLTILRAEHQSNLAAKDNQSNGSSSSSN